MVGASFLSLSAHLGFQSPGWRPIAGLIAMLASNITRHSAVILSNNRALCYRAVCPDDDFNFYAVNLSECIFSVNDVD
ncbi:hypothetical protein WN943_012825 [Citrus x changshan-huyou]